MSAKGRETGRFIVSKSERTHPNVPAFYLQLRDGAQDLPSDVSLDFPSLEAAYLAVCADMPEAAKELLARGRDPLNAYYTISDARGRSLMTVPFSDVLSPTEWRLAKSRRRPHGGLRSSGAKQELALASFRQMFGEVDAGCVLLDVDMNVVEMNAFGARHSHVDPDAIRGASIVDIFDLSGEPKSDSARFWDLARAGAVSEIVDMPYLVLDEAGRTVQGCWNARTWPIFDDDKHLLGFVEWAEPHTTPTKGGKTEIRISPGSTA